jgi:hypothetical protein
MRRFGVLAVSLILVFASCAEDSEPEAQEAEPEAVAVEADDYKFAAPKSAASGAVAVTLTNNGEEPHQAQLFQLNEGVEIGDLVNAAKEDATGLGLLEMGTYVGGPNAIDPGESQVAMASLEAGDYAFVCLVPDAKGQAHLGLGMVSALEVTQADEEAEAPDAEFSASMDDFSFTAPEEWQGTIAVENVGEQPHEFQIMEIAEGKTAEDFENWFKADPAEAGPPTWTTGGGSAVIAPGGTATFEADLDPATYYMMCFVADPEKKAPHFALGMMQKFEVE